MFSQQQQQAEAHIQALAQEQAQAKAHPQAKAQIQGNAEAPATWNRPLMYQPGQIKNEYEQAFRSL
jgi:hypothetical protein